MRHRTNYRPNLTQGLHLAFITFGMCAKSHLNGGGARNSKVVLFG